ncbi:hypothetical protein E4U21_005725 [Claviceps maximensis]|nr:hypothetical protein E4U21_005725 [Claviceps maximensis]
MAMSQWCLHYDEEQDAQPDNGLLRGFADDIFYTLNSSDNSSANSSAVHQAAPTTDTMTAFEIHSNHPVDFHFSTSPPTVNKSQQDDDQCPRKLFAQVTTTTSLDARLGPGESSSPAPAAASAQNADPDTDLQARAAEATKSPETDDNKGASRSSLREEALSKNRIAASKCRKRKIEWIERLEQVAGNAEGLYVRLMSERLCLMQEISMLKGQLIRHSVCRSPSIDIWIANEALRYVQELSDEASPSLSSSMSLNGN